MHSYSIFARLRDEELSLVENLHNNELSQIDCSYFSTCIPVSFSVEVVQYLLFIFFTHNLFALCGEDHVRELAVEAVP